MQYTVVHSADPYLLARLATDLQMEGIENEEEWNDIYNPFTKCAVKNYYLSVGQSGAENMFTFYCHNGVDNPIRHELTSRNYIKVLTQILQP